MALNTDTLAVQQRELESRVIIAPGELHPVVDRIIPHVKDLNDLLRQVAQVRKASEVATEMMQKSGIPDTATDSGEQKIVAQMEENLREADRLKPSDEKAPELAIAFSQLQADLTAFHGGDWRKANARSSQVKAGFTEKRLSLELAHALNSLNDDAKKVGPSMS